MPLASVGAMERRQTVLAIGGVVDEQGRVVTCATHSGGCRYRASSIWDETQDMIWGALNELPPDVHARCWGDSQRGFLVNVGEISKYRASLPCEVVEIPKDEVRRRTESAKRERALKEFKRTHPSFKPPTRDAELLASYERHRLDRQQQSHTQDVREGYGDAVPAFEETE